MLTLCAWCEKEGRRTVLHEGDEHGPISHGICPEHEQKMLELAMKLPQLKRGKNPRRRKRK